MRKKDSRKKAVVVQRLLDPNISGLGKSTIISYWSGVRPFFDVNQINNPDDYIVDVRILENIDRVRTLDKYEDDIRRFATSIKDIPPKTQGGYISAIKKFFEVNRIDLPSQLWNQIKILNHIKRIRPITMDKIPDQADLKAIISHGGLKERALFLVNATSGTRIGELTDLTFDNLKLEKRMLIIRDTTAKDHYQRITYITEEAKIAFEEWLKERRRYLKHKYVKSLYVRKQLEKQGYTIKMNSEKIWEVYQGDRKLTIDEIVDLDKRVFPFTTHTARQMWNSMLEKAGTPYNEKDNNPQLNRPRYKYHIHCLKKFWKSQMRGLVKTETERQHINSMIAHESQLDEIYAPFQPEDLKETYDKYCDILSIFSDRHELEKVIKPKIKEQDTAIASIMRENQKLTEQVDQMNRMLKVITDSMGDELKERIEMKNTLASEPTVTQTIKTKNGRSFKVSQRV